MEDSMSPTLDGPASLRGKTPIAALEQQLQASPYWSIRQLVCQIDRDRIVVRGTVSSYYLKQVALSLVAKVAGPQRVESDVEVRPEELTSPV
jgi:hypothetical protein